MSEEVEKSEVPDGGLRCNDMLGGLFRTHYRTVTDNYAGFENQFRFWWMPFWWQIGTINTYQTLRHAEIAMEHHLHKKVVVKVYA